MFVRKTIFVIRNDKVLLQMKFVILAKITFNYVNFCKEKIVFHKLIYSKTSGLFSIFLSFTKRNARGM